ncbi:MAG: 16S rRNA (uracil(1498)-N(3))-methyltransferase [Rhodospirillaceae bacterium]|nr:16S rRNA (uracil(1498)-N(3))-methyltransferase [Rhodospirillaceae bacterium]
MSGTRITGNPCDPGIRLYVKARLDASVAIQLSRGQSHYLRNVMRLEVGDVMTLFNGQDGEWQGSLVDLAKPGARVTVTAQIRRQQVEPDIWLCFAPIKKMRIDFVAQKASEMGVSALQPVMTRFTNVTRVNEDRLRANAVEAAEQCARLTVPAVRTTVKLDTLIGHWPSDRHILLLDETRTTIPIIESLQRRGDTRGQPWAVFVGPEGGYAPEELDLLHRLPNVMSVGLGTRLLRADTAAVAALACWQAVLGDWPSAATWNRDG